MVREGVVNLVHEKGNLVTKFDIGKNKRLIHLCDTASGAARPQYIRLEVFMITATELLAKGELLEERGDYTSARRMYEKALSIQERTLGADDSELIPYLYNLSLIQCALENEIDAQRLLTRLLTLLIRKHGESHEEVEEIKGFLKDLKPRRQLEQLPQVAVTA